MTEPVQFSQEEALFAAARPFPPVVSFRLTGGWEDYPSSSCLRTTAPSWIDGYVLRRSNLDALCAQARAIADAIETGREFSWVRRQMYRGMALPSDRWDEKPCPICREEDCPTAGVDRDALWAGYCRNRFAKYCDKYCERAGEEPVYVPKKIQKHIPVSGKRRTTWLLTLILEQEAYQWAREQRQRRMEKRLSVAPVRGSGTRSLTR